MSSSLAEAPAASPAEGAPASAEAEAPQESIRDEAPAPDSAEGATVEGAPPPADAPPADATPADAPPTDAPPTDASADGPPPTDASADGPQEASAPAAADEAGDKEQPADSGEAPPAEPQAGVEGTADASTTEAPVDPAQPAAVEQQAEESGEPPPPLPEPAVEQVEVADTSLSVDVRHQNEGLMQETGDVAARALAAVEGAMKELEEAESAIQDDTKRASIEKRKEQLQEHQEELRQIIASSKAGSLAGSAPPSTRAGPDPAAAGLLRGPAFAALQGKVAELEERNLDSVKTLPPESPAAQKAVDETVTGYDFEGLASEVEDIRLVRRQLDCVEVGRPAEEAPVGPEATWYDAQEVEKEVAELRRVRHQIRCLFGGMMPAGSSQLKVDELLNDDVYDTLSLNSGYHPGRLLGDPSGNVGYAGSVPVPGSGLSPVSQISPFGGPAAEAALPMHPTVHQSEVARDSSSPKQAPLRPPSHAGSQASHSSASTYNSRKDEDERRKERKEKRHRRHRDRSERTERDESQDRSLNWAEEVVKASMDPHNQWEFPSNDAGRPSPPVSRPPRARGQPSWEQPRQSRGAMGGPPRSGDVAAKARERAEEVMRKERELENQRLVGQ